MYVYTCIVLLVTARIEDSLTDEKLHRLEQIFASADEDDEEGLDMEEFRSVDAAREISIIKLTVFAVHAACTCIYMYVHMCMLFVPVPVHSGERCGKRWVTRTSLTTNWTWSSCGLVMIFMRLHRCVILLCSSDILSSLFCLIDAITSISKTPHEGFAFV